MSGTIPLGQTGSFRRPLSVRLLNKIGPFMESVGAARIGFSPDALTKAARKETGLNDFGPGDFEEGLARLCESLQKEAHLHFLGRLLWREYLKNLLKVKLHTQYTFCRHPEVSSVVVERPMFVIGFPRSGTTLLYNLLACNPSTRSPLLWEAYESAPPPALLSLAEITQKVRKYQRFFNTILKLAPPVKTIHYFHSATAKEECFQLLAPSFAAAVFPTAAYLPSYEDWLDRMSHERLIGAYQVYARGVKMLMYGHDGTRWLSKSPLHCWFMAAILETFPDACIVHTVRDPREAVPSTCSLYHGYRSPYTDDHRPKETGELILRLYDQYLERLGRLRASTAAARIKDVDYQSLLQDPIGEVARIHEYFGIPLSAEAECEMARWIPKNPYDPNKVGRHSYTAAQFGLDPNVLTRWP